MSLENVVKFWQEVEDDQQLQQSLQSLGNQGKDDRPAEMAKLANEKGFSVTGDELLAADAVFSFWEQVKNDEALQEKLKPSQELSSAEDSLAAVLEVAQGAGFSFSKDQLAEITSAQAKAGASQEADVSDEELESVVGGLSLSFSSSLNIARRGMLSPKSRFGPGMVASYM